MRKSKILWFTLAGMVAGYLLVHPYAMLAYILGPEHTHTIMGLKLQLRQAFRVEGLVMGGAFAFMGGVAGLFLGAWYLIKKESQRRQVALETLQELMVTLAHHIRNANLVIGGFSNRLLKNLSDSEAQTQLAMIQQASREIDAVIASLESLTEIKRTQYAGAWETRMIDLKKELEARLNTAEDLKKNDVQQ